MSEVESETPVQADEKEMQNEETNANGEDAKDDHEGFIKV